MGTFLVDNAKADLEECNVVSVMPNARNSKTDK
jgi:hypothetical protein